MKELLVLVLVSIITIVASQSNDNEQFRLFLENALDNYPAWLRENNLDPSFQSNQSYDISVIGHPTFSLTCIIKDEQVIGFTNETNELEIWDIGSKLILRTFTINYAVRGIFDFQGNYTANGTTENDISVQGTGPWKYRNWSGIHEYVHYKFQVTPDGYVDISDGPLDYSVYPLSNSRLDMVFEGLLDDGAGGYATDIKYNLIYQYHLRLLESSLGQPTRTLMHLYLSDIFQKTPLDEIIGQNNTSLSA